MKALDVKKQGIESTRELNSEAKEVKKKVKEPLKKNRVYVPEIKAFILTNKPPEFVRNYYIKLYARPEPEPKAEAKTSENEIIQPESEHLKKPEQPENTDNPNIRISKSGKKYFKI